MRTVNNNGGGLASAKLTAVPTSGAEHGVARRVTRNPLEKSAPNLLLLLPPAEIWLMPAGSGTVILSNRDKLNSTITTDMKHRKYGFWNWVPQPMLCPASCTKISPAARTAKLVRMPAVVASIRRRIVMRSCPPISAMLASLIVSTGKTHGITFKIIPPRNAITRSNNADDRLVPVPEDEPILPMIAGAIISAN